MQMPFSLNNFVNDIIVLLGILALMSQITSHILFLVLPIAGGCILYQVCTPSLYIVILYFYYTNGLFEVYLILNHH